MNALQFINFSKFQGEKQKLDATPQIAATLNGTHNCKNKRD